METARTGNAAAVGGGPGPADEAPLAYRAAERHPAVVELVRRHAAGLAVDIHADDEMYRYLLDLRGGDRDIALVDYLRTGWGPADVLGQLLAWRFGGAAEPPRVLDFASGYGRVTRFLVLGHPAARFWVSDLAPAAVDFQRRTFGVEGFVSAHAPEELRGAPQVDAVLASSLFSHLPRRRFVPWLARLFELVAPGGLLAVSVLGEAALPAGRSLPADGLLFASESEIDALDREEYGATWVSEGFVRAAFAAIGVPAGAVRVFPRALWHLQDLWVAVRSPATGGAAAPLSGVELDRGPQGDLYAAARDGARGLSLEGWAVDRGPAQRPLTVRVLWNGEEVAAVAPREVRPDVVAAVGAPAGLATGWRCRVAPASAYPAPGDLLHVVAESGSGRSFILFLGTFQGLLAGQEARRLRAELAAARSALAAADRLVREHVEHVARLERHIAGMEASGFWKARDVWVALKRRLSRGGGRWS